MKEMKYKDFIVYQKNENNIFIHVKIDSSQFYEDMINFFFSNEKILNYINNKTNIKFNGSIQHYVSLYKALSGFIDDENLELNIDDLKKELSNYIDWENYSDTELLKLRRDKIGKIGEYIMHHILNDYFKFTCILPKLALITNKNMSVFGIDVIFFDNSNKMLLFGESKVTKDIDNGIKLINLSLLNYEHQICEEYRTILSSNLLSLSLPASLKQYIGKSISFKKFIEVADIKIIGIPIFIMSGQNVNKNEIFEKLEKIQKTTILNLNVVYYIINLPIIDKNIFQSKIIEFLKERCDYYESNC